MIAAPYRLVTLLEILQFNAEAFCRLSSVVGQMLVILEQGRIPAVDAMGGSLGELHREAQRLKLHPVDRQLERIKEHFTGGQATVTTMRPMIVDLYNRLLEEFEGRFLLIISPETVDYYRQSKPLFGSEVWPISARTGAGRALSGLDAEWPGLRPAVASFRFCGNRIFRRGLSPV